MNEEKKFIVFLSEPEARNPSQFGPKTANQAILAHAGLPTPGGFCLSAEAYQAQVKALGLSEVAEKAMNLDFFKARPFISQIRIAMFDAPMIDEIALPLIEAYQNLTGKTEMKVAVRSSSLMEDTVGASFAGQFQTYLGIENEKDFLTAVHGCWGALWSSRALRYMDSTNIKVVDAAMSVLVQPLIQAVASGGGLSKTARDGMSLTATWGLGESIAQGEIVPDRYELGKDGRFLEMVSGRKAHTIHCHLHGSPTAEVVAKEQVSKPCLNEAQVFELGAMMKKAEALLGRPVEIEWTMDKAGIRLLQARPLHLESSPKPNQIWNHHPSITGQPAGVGWGSGRACVIACECELGRVAPGDILVTKVAGPALSQVLPFVSGVVAELGGSTSHLASLARERGIPMVLGARDATSEIPDGGQVAVDGVMGVVRWVPA